MSHADTVRSEALRLPRRVRTALAHELIASLDGPADEDVEGAWLSEIQRRAREVVDGTAVLEDRDVVRERIATKLRALRR